MKQHLFTPHSSSKKAIEAVIDTLELKKAALVIRAVNHHLRQEMLTLIHAKGEMNVKDLYMEFRLEQSVASQHLAILRKAGVVTARKESKFVKYSINIKRVEELSGLISGLSSFIKK